MQYQLITMILAKRLDVGTRERERENLSKHKIQPQAVRIQPNATILYGDANHPFVDS